MNGYLFVNPVLLQAPCKLYSNEEIGVAFEVATYTAALGVVAAAVIALFSLLRRGGAVGDLSGLDLKLIQLLQRLEEHGRVLREEFATSRKEAADGGHVPGGGVGAVGRWPAAATATSLA
jgi:hypothetical protein